MLVDTWIADILIIKHTELVHFMIYDVQLVGQISFFLINSFKFHIWQFMKVITMITGNLIGNVTGMWPHWVIKPFTMKTSHNAYFQQMNLALG